MHDYHVEFFEDRERKKFHYKVFERVYADARIDSTLIDDYINNGPIMKENKPNHPGKLWEKDLILLPERVFAFSLRDYKFG